ncbi:uncharacterized protein klhdc7a [Narcine bancroftii]|uniref:uncharacterized protein klhdc7a n=1 Tax=Narcine bancroftii TaxID=1343680 RepID=UPI0038316DB9
MEFAGKAIVSAVFVITVTLIYRYYRVRAANAARRRTLGSSDCRGSSETLASSSTDAEPCSQRLDRQGCVSDLEKRDLTTLSADKGADIYGTGREDLQTTGELNNGTGQAKRIWLQGKVRRLGISEVMMNHPAESRDNDLPSTTATADVCAIRNFQAARGNETNSNQNTGAVRVKCKSGGALRIVGEEDYSNGFSPRTGAEQLVAYYGRATQLGQKSSSCDVVSAEDDPKNRSLSANVNDLLMSPASNAIKCTQSKPAKDEPPEFAENDMLEGLISRQCTAGIAGEHTNNLSACKIYPEIKIQGSNTPSVQSTYQVKHEKTQTGSRSEGELNILQPGVEVNHNTTSASEMTIEANEYQEKNSTCSVAQITTDQVPVDTGHLNDSAFCNQMRDKPGVYRSLHAIQDNASQGLTVKPKVVCSSLSEHPEASGISSSSAESGIKVRMEERTTHRKRSISAIAESPAFLVDFQSEAQVCSEESHSGGFSSKAHSVGDLSSSSLGSLVDSLYSSQPDLSKETAVEIVAGANFIPILLSNQSTVEIMKCRLDLGNCYEILCVAKKHNLRDLQDAAYQVMSDNYLQVLKDPSIYGQLKLAERELILSRRMYGKKYLMVADVDVHENVWNKTVVQHHAEGQTTVKQLTPLQNNHKIYYYNNENDSWYPLVDLEVESISKDCAVCTMYNYLFIVAGCQGSGKKMKLSNKVFCYNPVTNIWSEISPLKQARPNCKLVALDGYLYAIGGECLCTVEKYDPRTDRWTFTAPLPQGIFAVTHKATVCNGEIYVSRGISYNQLLRYNPKENTWNDCILMSKKDRTTDIAAVKNFIYRFEVNQDYGISVFRYNIISKTGHKCASKKLCKMTLFQCAVMGDTIYCINKQLMMQFVAHEMSPHFKAEDCTVLPGAKGILFPFVLTLPERSKLQTQV